MHSSRCASNIVADRPEPALANIDAINAVFSAETVAEILARLDAYIEEEGAEADRKHWAVTARKLMVRCSARCGARCQRPGPAVPSDRATADGWGGGRQAAASPTSLAVTHRAIDEGRQLADLGKCLEMEFLIAQRFMRGADFFEGVGNMLGLGESVTAAPALLPGRFGCEHWADSSR